jgi:hypothetical protein
VFIAGNPEATHAAKGANIEGVHYSRRRSGEASLGRGVMAGKTMPACDATAARALAAAIKGAVAKTR